MLVYGGYTPAMSGTAFVPGGTGTPPELLYHGYRMTSLVKFPMETWEPAFSNYSGHSFDPSGTGVSHGFEQMFLWGDYIQNSAGYDKYRITSGLINPYTAYQRFNYGTPIVTRNGVWALQSNILTAESGSDKVIFNITSTRYSVSAFHIYEDVYIPYATYQDTASYSANFTVGGFNLMDSAGYKNLDVGYGPVGIVNGLYISGGTWSASSNIINGDYLTIKYDYTLNSKRALSSYTVFSKQSFPASTTALINRMDIRTTAYGDIYKYY